MLILIIVAAICTGLDIGTTYGALALNGTQVAGGTIYTSEGSPGVAWIFQLSNIAGLVTMPIIASFWIPVIAIIRRWYPSKGRLVYVTLVAAALFHGYAGLHNLQLLASVGAI